MILPQDLEVYFNLMKTHNVEHLEMGDLKITIKLTSPELIKAKTTIDKLDRLANKPSQDELEMWSSVTVAKDPLVDILPKRKGS